MKWALKEHNMGIAFWVRVMICVIWIGAFIASLFFWPPKEDDESEEDRERQRRAW